MSSAGMDSAERSDESNVQVRNSVPRGTRGARAGMGRGLRRSAPRRTRRSTEEMSELVASSVAREISSQLLPLLEELRRSLNTSSPCEETSAGNAVLTNAASNDTGILIAATAARDADCNGRQTFGRATCTGTSNQPKHDSSLDCAGVNDHSAQASADTVRYERSVREDDWIDAFGGTANDNTQTSTYALCSLSQQLAPAIKIEPFDGDPRNWESFIGSFKVLVHDVIPSNAQRAAILRQLLTPRLRATIGTSLSSPGSYARALKDLRRLFGDPSLVVDASIQDLLRVAPMKSNSKEELEKFFFVVHGIITTLCTKNAAAELESKTSMQILASKLHRNLQSAWAKRVYDLRPRGATLVDFSKFLEEAVMVNNSVFLNGSDNRSSNPSTSVPDNRQRGHLHVMKTERENRNCPLCQGDHSLPACPTFASSSVQRRSEIARDLHRCFNCLNGSHLSRTCRSRSSCNVEGCRGKHHSLLHGASRVYAKLGGPHALKPPQPQEHIEDFHVGASAVTPMDCQVLLAVLPAQIVANGRSCKAMVLLDPGSEATLITEELAFRLGLSGPRRRLRFSTFHGRDPTLVSTSVAFRVSSVDGKRSFDVCNAYTVPQLNVSQRKVDWNTMRSRWNHLKDVQIHAPMGTKVDILLGMDVQDVHEQLQVLKAPGKLTAPVAIETPLGWCIVGKNPLAKRKGDVPTGPRITHVHYRGDAPELDELLPSLWLTESMGTMPMAKPPMSAEDKESIRILNSSIRHTGERYEVGLLWKTPKPALPNNRPAAERRLLYLEKRFAKDVRFARSYEAAIKEYVKNGHAVKVADEDLLSSKNVWFLPHHGVTNINKPGKVRVVFDASAAYNGISLNDCLMKGPDLSTSLAELLLRFRQRPVAVSADIEKMFNQVGVKQSDRPSLCFLWRPPGSNGPVQVFQMAVQIFGAVSSPATCIFALRKTAEDFECQLHETKERVRTNFYVDNFLDSMETEQEAIQASHDLRSLLRKGGFHLTKWMSTSQRLLDSFRETEGTEHSQRNLNLDLDRLPIHRTLGVLWDSKNDEFLFSTKINADATTKRQILRAIATVFDPLGFLSPIFLNAKHILQRLWKFNCSWDEEIPEELQRHWMDWAQGTSSLASLRIPRCLRYVDRPKPLEQQVHVFSDASEKGFGCVCYLRNGYDDGVVYVAFIMAKFRLAPLRQLSIPRLELQGALLSVRVASLVSEALRMPLKSFQFWTDSMTVLRWIYSKKCRFNAFVANRIGEILEFTERNQWRHVPGASNPADCGSRGTTIEQLLQNSLWLNGPEFLHCSSDHWPRVLKVDEPSPNDPAMEVKERWIGVLQPTQDQTMIMQLIDSCSNLTSLKGRFAYVLRFVANIRRPPDQRSTGPLTAAELKTAFQHLIIATQKVIYRDEIEYIGSGRPLKGCSRLNGLTAYIDHSGLLRVQGRLERAPIPDAAKHPIALAKCHLLDLIVIETHQRLFHASTEHVLAQLRQRYWIHRGRACVKRILNQCWLCRKFKSKPSIPLMAPLPADRLKAFAPPFNRTGIDFFGPFLVSVRRSREKRYGVMFTCLVTRAVHLELAYSLTTDAFLTAFRRFTSRRGCPSVCYSDNGTNLVAGERELKEGIRRWNKADIANAMAQKEIEWHFSPPFAPHFGGAWERLVRSAKSALRHVLNKRVLNDETLHTILAEVEALLNSRPLTHVTMDPNENEPLTPNHFLLGRACPSLPPDVVTAEQITSTRQWKSAQAIVEHFWARWLREYVPNLIERRKWLRDRRTLKQDDVVLIVDENLPRGHWLTGRVLEVWPGPDGLVRTATVRTARGDFKRPVIKLCLLEAGST